mmetsp:Transcript_12618/g.15659  ORF Transcript_12618/g.15659 Transcript_12618/m.15659 type:complete len:394 (-) Transcript_12618:795-1976(-)|eukprot:CAMPEP_0204866530 /NCGR_PEP_ID=MMETSP1348-20121228/17798_1 /ASSEMBLY_ACC=CAM_ASM_000700 /TAXON_ID=215587 /ORGANISM="Aplanochytrium stocchinoi, Strain GSBS06" /LENGTH=393 /DNA_ID=CAMNT_0052018455 /DNA_START=145 /DNA_END=1326 /DNA_ORIENTATION=-
MEGGIVSGNKEKLQSYEKNLVQVSELLKDNPSDENLLKLKGDLIKVIELTKTLVEEQTKVNLHSEKDTYANTNSGVDYSNANSHVSQNLSSNSSAQKRNVQEISLNPKEIPKKKKKKGKGFHVGERCEVELNGRWYACIIDSINQESSQTASVSQTYDVRYILNDREEKGVEANSGRVREIKGKKGKPELDIFSLKLGALVFAKYSGDGQWYKARVTEIAKEGCIVQYVDYGNKEKVPFEYMYNDKEIEAEAINPYMSVGAGADVLITGTGTSGSASQSQNNSAVPEHLRILPTDSESVQKSKKRRLKELKRRSKSALQEHMSQQRQRGWQDFQAKKKGKRTKGHYASIKKKSIFAVPEGEVDGMGIMSGRVGVIGSGKGMTKFNDTRIKHNQ